MTSFVSSTEEFRRLMSERIDELESEGGADLSLRDVAEIGFTCRKPWSSVIVELERQCEIGRLEKADGRLSYWIKAKIRNGSPVG